MKTLIITAHPSKFGFTHKIAAEYSKAAIEKGREVEILDLYSPENKQDFLIFENIKEMPFDATVERMQAKISESHELVFIFPLWWYGEPAVMKNFWDKNFAARFAYHYVNGRPVGLLNGKTARVFFTSDGAWYYQWLLLQPVRNIWWLTRLGFCGIRMKSFVVFSSMRTRDEKKRNEFLAKVYKIAKG
ncbi:MAG: NAD(P)H dehydrogenase (Quinone) [Candidatus Moranbacteria bacterium GW2011_GWD2_38_7]|nr:MAG: NAD(P)H dehydrogenase (Quinone) [Candidatus Moranbacteria bacterium GW2011_GWD2_38_7]